MDLLPHGKRTVISDIFGVSSSGDEFLDLSPFFVCGLGEFGESPVARRIDLLPAGELHLGSSESLDSGSLMLVLAPEGDQTLSDVDTSDGTLGFSECTSHTSLEPISTSTRQHLVDSQDVEGMFSDSDVEAILAYELDHVLVSTDTGSLESFRGELFLLVRDKMDTSGEIVDMSPLATKIIDPDLGVGDTTAEPRFRVRLVLAVPVASGRTSTHG